MDRLFLVVLAVAMIGFGVGIGYVARKAEAEAAPDVRSLLKQKTKYLHESNLVRVIDPGAEVVCYEADTATGTAISCLPIQLMGKADDEETQ